MIGRRVLVGFLAAVAVLLLGTVAFGYFSATSATGGSGGSSADSVGTGAKPTTSQVGQAVTVSWSASTLGGGHAVDGYLIKRYDTNGNLQSIGSGCSGTIAALTCTETGVPAGQWQYTVTPLIGSNWRGQESDKSSVVAIVTTSISLNPTSGHIGDTVSVSGSGYPASSAITATYDGGALTLSGTTTTDSSGNVPSNVSFAVPASSAGSHTVRLSAGGQSATATFAVTPHITLNATSGVAGTTDTVTGTGFAATSALTGTFGGTAVTLSPSTSDASGGFTATYTVPNQAPGTHTVTVTDGSSNSASATYTVNTPSVGLSPTSGHVGATVTLSGSNFPAGSSITATYDSGALTLSGTTTTTAAGAIPSGVTFAVPASTAGAHTVTITAGTRSASQTFTVQPQITLNPASGGAGSSDSISGTGFGASSSLSATFNSSAITLGGSTSTDANGSFSGATYTVPGVAPNTYSVAVTDASNNSATASYTTMFGPVSKLSVAAANANPTAGATDNLTITAQDASGNTVTSYTGDKSLTFSGASNSPNGTHPTAVDKGGTAVNFGTATTITFASGVASVASGKNGVMTLPKAGSTTVTATDASSIAGSATVFVNSAGVTVSFSPSCPATIPKNNSTTFTLSIPSDSFGNAFTTQASAAFGLTLTPTGSSSSGNWGFGTTVGTLTATANVTTGPLNNTFKVTESGGSKTATLSTTVPSGFTAPGTCSLTASS